MKNNKMQYLLYLLFAIVIFLFILYVLNTIEMYIDHECYQLQPNERYVKSICEKYWGD